MKTRIEVEGMKVVDLRVYAKELGIKNVKKFSKEELIKMILNTQGATEINENATEVVEEVKVEEVAVEEPVVETEEIAFVYDPEISDRIEFYQFVDKYEGLIEKKENKIEIAFPKSTFEAAIKEYQNNKKFGTHFYCYDLYLFMIILVKKEVKKRKKRVESSDVPRGEQSLAIYNMMIEHPNWTHYKIKSILNCTYTNVRRVYTKYIKGTERDGRKA